jgi:hypothetical protein
MKHCEYQSISLLRVDVYGSAGRAVEVWKQAAMRSHGDISWPAVAELPASKKFRLGFPVQALGCLRGKSLA